MIDFCSNTWSDFKEWVHGSAEESDNSLDSSWTYYTQERAVFKGFPIAVISTIAANYLIQATTLSNAAIFATVNYITLTSLIEILSLHYEIKREETAILFGFSGLISFAFIQTVCKTSLTYQTAIVLGVAAFAGQISRELLKTDELGF